MAVNNGWGQGTSNNSIGWGLGASNNSNGWGSVYGFSESGDTDIVGRNPNFVITIDTTKSGVSGTDQFNFTGALGDYDVIATKSTGEVENFTGLSDAATITFANGSGVYELQVVPATVNGFNKIAFNNGGDKLKLIEINNVGDVVWSTFERAFRGCSNVTYANLSGANTSNVTSMYHMMSDWSSITTPPDLSSWDVSNVTNMSVIMGDWSSITTPPDLSNWDVSNVTNMGSMMRGWSITTPPDLSNWDVSNVTIMDYMMYNWSSITTPPDLSSWNVSNVTNMGSMMRGWTSCAETVDISTWNAGKVTNGTNFLLNSNGALDTDIYDDFLIYNDSLPSVSASAWHFGDATYTSAASAARASLASKGWVITDGGLI